MSQRVRQVLPCMDDREHLHAFLAFAIEDAIRRHHQFPHIERTGVSCALAELRLGARQLEAMLDAEDHPFGVDGRSQTYVVDDRFQMSDRSLRPAEREHYEARRSRARTRVIADSWSTVCPASASAIPCSIA